MSARIRTYGTASVGSGIDRRVEATDTVHDFVANIHASATNTTRTNEVEVQAFIPDGNCGNAIVSLSIHVKSRKGFTNGGMADLMLTPDEAMAVAKMLILATAEAEDLNR